MAGLGFDLGRPSAGPLQGIAAAADFMLELTEQQGQLSLPAFLGGDFGAKPLLFAYPMTVRPCSNPSTS
jgi:hypothetical protein